MNKGTVTRFGVTVPGSGWMAIITRDLAEMTRLVAAAEAKNIQLERRRIGLCRRIKKTIRCLSAVCRP